MRVMKKASDEGSVAVIVGIVMAVLTLPLLVLVIDGGGLFGERRQLQNDADAAALAAAQYCSSVSNCDRASAFVKAAALVNANDGGTGSFDAAAGRNRGATFENTSWYLCGTAVSVACDPVYIDGRHSSVDCPEAAPALPSAQTYVQVRVISGGTGWSGFIGTGKTPVFACSRAITHGPQPTSSPVPGYTPAPMPSVSPGVSPSTYSTVYPGTPASTETNPGSGSPGKATSLAFTMPQCVWAKITNNGAKLGPAAAVTYETDKLTDLLSSATPPCTSNAISSSANGGLVGAKSGGGVTPGVTVNSSVRQETGNPNSYTDLRALITAHPDSTWLVPVYDATGTLTKSGSCSLTDKSGTGSNLCYHILGFVGFHISTFSLVGSALYFQGYFTTLICTDAMQCSSTGPDYGVSNPPTTTVHPATSPSTYTTVYPGTSASTYMITYPPVPPTVVPSTIPGDPTSAKPVL